MTYIDILLILLIIYIFYTLYKTRKILSDFIKYHNENNQNMMKVIIDMSIEFKDFRKDFKVLNDRFEIFKREYKNDKASILKNIKKIENDYERK